MCLQQIDSAIVEICWSWVNTIYSKIVCKATVRSPNCTYLRFELADPLLRRSRHIIKNKSIINFSILIFLPPPHPNPRTHHFHTIHIPFARTSSFSVCNLWNSLPEEVVSLPSSRSFKAALSQLPPFTLWCRLLLVLRTSVINLINLFTYNSLLSSLILFPVSLLLLLLASSCYLTVPLLLH